MSTLESKDMYEEGLKIPPVKLFEEGKLNPLIFDFMRANIRVPEKVLGDIRAQLVANNVCARGLARLLDEYRLDGLEELGREVIVRTEQSLRRKIAALPDGRYRNSITLPPIPGTADQVTIKVAVSIEGDQITIDYDGSSGPVGAAINCTLNMTKSYSTYPIKLALDPDVPNNEGGLRPIRVLAPRGSVLNCDPPAATWGRTMISHLLPEIIFATIESLVPDKVLAANGGCPANEVYLHGKRRDGRNFLAIAQHSGGFGASAYHDGYGTLCFPNNTANIPVEVTENEATMYYLKKEYVTDSGGPGRKRGGTGQEVAFRITEGADGSDGFVEGSVRLNGRSAESSFPVIGRQGGGQGRGTGLWLDDAAIDHGVYRRMRPGQTVRFVLGGGGGYGDPLEREPEHVAKDVREGFVSIDGARADYGVILNINSLSVDEEATAALREAKRGNG